MPVNVVEFPEQPAARDIPAALRLIADQIENGEFGDAHNLAYVIDQGNSNISIGMLGQSVSPCPECYYLYGLAMRKLENI